MKKEERRTRRPTNPVAKNDGGLKLLVVQFPRTRLMRVATRVGHAYAECAVHTDYARICACG